MIGALCSYRTSYYRKADIGNFRQDILKVFQRLHLSDILTQPFKFCLDPSLSDTLAPLTQVWVLLSHMLCFTSYYSLEQSKYFRGHMGFS